MNTPTQMMVPAGMRQVSKEEFWAAVMSETRNIHPNSEKHHTTWELVNTRQRWGWSSHGYIPPLGQVEIFALEGSS